MLSTVASNEAVSLWNLGGLQHVQSFHFNFVDSVLRTMQSICFIMVFHRPSVSLVQSSSASFSFGTVIEILC